MAGFGPAAIGSDDLDVPTGAERTPFGSKCLPGARLPVRSGQLSITSVLPTPGPVWQFIR